MKRQLQSFNQAKARGTQHKTPCADCPWTRTSLPGWLGSIDAPTWLSIAHGDGKVECHTLCDAKRKPWECAGLAIYRANVAKNPRDPEVLRLPVDKEKVFSTPVQFLEHHNNVKPAKM